jgi:2-polyprenyl-6-methoxyphenol hydroxylase-like FAD-dependent oxidoreductase
VPDALRQLAADPDGAYFDSVSQVVMDRWSHGRVVLLGDAALCVTLFAGYGAALALAGAGADRLGAARRGAGDNAQIWAQDLMMRAIQLPGIRGLMQRSLRRANQ